MKPGDDVTPMLKPDLEPCECGCGAVGRPKKNGHARNCDHKACAKCRNANNRVKGRRKQAKAVTALGVPRSALHPGHEEFMGGAVRLEVKAGAKHANPVGTHYKAAEAQSEASRAIGDNRPFVAVFMPDGWSHGIVAIRTDRLAETVAAIAENLGVVS